MSDQHPFERTIDTRSGVVHHAFLACSAKINPLTGGRDLHRVPTATAITCLWCMAKWLNPAWWGIG